jgi:hypothetical protein
MSVIEERSQVQTPVATAVLLERHRLAEKWAEVRRPDGSLDEQRLVEFERALQGPN